MREAADPIEEAVIAMIVEYLIARGAVAPDPDAPGPAIEDIHLRIAARYGLANSSKQAG